MGNRKEHHVTIRARIWKRGSEFRAYGWYMYRDHAAALCIPVFSFVVRLSWEDTFLV
jgi:hypothetical protein